MSDITYPLPNSSTFGFYITHVPIQLGLFGMVMGSNHEFRKMVMEILNLKRGMLAVSSVKKKVVGQSVL